MSMYYLSRTPSKRTYIIAGPSGLAVISLLKEDSIFDKGKTAKKFSEVMTSGIRSLHVIGSITRALEAIYEALMRVESIVNNHHHTRDGPKGV
jgi:hypothetical protein